MLKIAIIGTSCSGKSTMCYSLVGRLKKDGILAEGVISTDRKFGYTHELLCAEEMIQCNIIFNQLVQETYWSSRKDVDVLILDRSPLDLFSYYDISFPEETSTKRMLRELVHAWIGQYSLIFYLPLLEYVHDGKRPTDEFRVSVDNNLKNKLHRIEGLINLSGVPLDNREEYVYERIRRTIQKQA